MREIDPEIQTKPMSWSTKQRVNCPNAFDDGQRRHRACTNI